MRFVYNPLRILMIEDSISDADLALRFLEQAGFKIEWVRIESAGAMKNALSSSTPSCPWHLIISDYNLPGFGALHALRILQSEGVAIPFILVSGAIGEEVAVEVIKAGAVDFVMKSKLSRLPDVVSRALRESWISRREIEERQRAEAAIRAREQVLSVVSHDLKNPLGAVELNLDLIERILKTDRSLEGADRDQQVLIRLERARRSTRRMKNMIHDILDQVKLESGRLLITKTRENFGDLIAEIFEMLQPVASKKSICLESKVLSSSLLGDFDYERVFQVVMNLVENAIKFTPEFGNVRMIVCGSEDILQFSVEDSGPGIPGEHQPYVFERFWQVNETSNSGLGLGLFIAKGIIDSHGGKMFVESKVGEGSKFCFTIPRWSIHGTKDAFVGEMVTDKIGNGLDKKSILLVDDDDELREIIMDSLLSYGYEVFAFANAESGLDYLKNNQNPPGIILVDYNLPGMNGAEFVRQAKELPLVLDHTPIILASADSQIESKVHLLGVHSFLKKPVQLSELLASIRNSSLIHETQSNCVLE